MRYWLAALLVAIPAQEYPKNGIIWSESWDKAIEEAKWRNVPIHLAFLDDSGASVAAAAAYSDPKLIEASRMWVNLPVHPKAGHEVDAEVGGERVKVCERFWNIPCAVHVKHHGVSVPFKNLDQRPVSIFAKPTLDELGRCEGADLLAAMTRVKWPGTRVPYATWRDVKISKEEGERAFKAKEWRQAIDAFLLVRKPGIRSLKEHVGEWLDKINLQGELIFGDAYKKSADPATREEAKKTLQQIVKDFSPLKVAEKAQTTLAQLKAH
jgi:hypothetical protein